jgi:hypothetical protein
MNVNLSMFPKDASFDQLRVFSKLLPVVPPQPPPPPGPQALPFVSELKANKAELDWTRTEASNFLFILADWLYLVIYTLGSTTTMNLRFNKN